MKKIDAPRKVIFICDGKKCTKYNTGIRQQCKALIKENGLKKEFAVLKTECTDNCKHAPVMHLQPPNVWLGTVEVKDVAGIFKEYFL